MKWKVWVFQSTSPPKLATSCACADIVSAAHHHLRQIGHTTPLNEGMGAFSARAGQPRQSVVTGARAAGGAQAHQLHRAIAADLQAPVCQFNVRAPWQFRQNAAQDRLNRAVTRWVDIRKTCNNGDEWMIKITQIVGCQVVQPPNSWG